ncbi:hypothetical protein CSB08_00480 [Candidatus Gracilibacteria bacterium]|nr:MAG: hypothetical protein CSB08_00480 [Candidatus Gracilibacteria bacterium]PIE85318.1 MAG: hypothetical protein CSA08_02830 [Candidatus Gracilibacteria bacterium]
MFKDKEIIEKIRKTKLFNSKLKQDIILYFNLLNKTQKNNLIHILNTEQEIIKNFLTSLKNKKIIRFEEIKGNIDNLQRQNSNLKELKEKAQDELEADNLLNKLDIV